MPFQLQPLDGSGVHEHIFERYTLLESLSHELSQDLGIYHKTDVAHVDIEPPVASRGKGKASRLLQPYNFAVEQSLTGLYSSGNGNSTTGYVLWSTTPIFAQWLLYDANASQLRQGGDVEVLGGPNYRNIPAVFSAGQATGIIELGGGISGILPVLLSNYVDHYVCTDQRGLLSKMEVNIRGNMLQLNKRRCVSKSMRIEPPGDQEPLRKTVNLEIMLLDWEKFQLNDGKRYPYLQTLSQETSTVYIVAMDVIYNDFLIDPFLKALKQLREFFMHKGLATHCLIGMQLRAQDVVADFLEKTILEYDLPINHIVDPSLEKTRFSLYYI